MRAVFLAFLLSCVPHLGQAQPFPHSLSFQQYGRATEEWIRALENPQRSSWQKPGKVVRALALQAGQRVADVGAGSGYFAVRFAKAVGPQGKVYAAEIDPGLVDYLGRRAKKKKLAQLEPLLAAPNDPRLPPESVDLVFFCAVLHLVQNRPAYYPKLARALRPGGRLAIIDFYKREAPVGPPLAIKLAKDDLIAELAQAGFTPRQEFDFLPYQYFLVFEPVRH